MISTLTTFSATNGSSCDDADWGQRFSELVSLVQQHSSEEQKEHFPKADELLGEHKANELEVEFLRCKKEAMGELS